MKKVLTYGIDEGSNRYEIIKESANKFDIEVVKINKNEIGEKVGALLGLDGFRREGVLRIKDEEIEFLLFSDFDREILRDFILDLKSKDVIVEHKSVVTETTKDWTFEYLVEHIKEEHKLVSEFNKLGKLINYANTMLKENYSKELEDVINFCLSAREIANISIEDIEIRYKKLLKAVGGINE